MNTVWWHMGSDNPKEVEAIKKAFESKDIDLANIEPDEVSAIYYGEEGKHLCALENYNDNSSTLFEIIKENGMELGLSKYLSHKKFQPFQKVLISYDSGFGLPIWKLDFFSHMEKSDKTDLYVCLSGICVFYDNKILPYEGNEDKLGKVIAE